MKSIIVLPLQCLVVLKYFYYVIAVLKLITLRDVEQLEIICSSALNSPKQAVNSIQ